MRKNAKLIIALTTELKNKLKERAEECCMTLSGYCLYLLANAKPKIEFIENSKK